jgi:hypothetical protein
VEEYNLLLVFWLEGFLERGPGAIVLHQVHTAVGDLRSVSEYWTLAEIRTFLRNMGHLDEFIYAWLLSINDQDAFPTILIGAGHGNDGERFSFYRIHRPVTEKSRKSR